MGLTIQ